MHFRLGVLLLLICCLFGCVEHYLGFGRAPIPDTPTAEDWPDVGAVILQDDAILSFEPRRHPDTHKIVLAGVLDRRRRLKVLRDQGLVAAMIDIDVYDDSRIENLEAQSISTDGERSTLQSKYIRMIEHTHDLEKHVSRRSMRFHIPGAMVGGAVEYRYQHIFYDISALPVYVFGSSYPVLHSEFSIISQPEIQLDYRYGVGEKIVDPKPLVRETEQHQRKLVFIEYTLPPYFSEPAMPHLSHIAPWIQISVQRSFLKQAPFRMSSWEDAVDYLTQQTQRVGSPHLVGTAAEQYLAWREKIKTNTVYTLQHQNITRAQDALNGKIIGTRDAAFALARSLQENNIHASVALVVGFQGPVAMQDFVTLSAFSRALVAVPVSELLENNAACSLSTFERSPLCFMAPSDLAFLDPLCRRCVVGEIPSDLMGTRGLILKDSGLTWIEIAEPKPEQNSIRWSFQGTLSEEGLVTGTFDAQANGFWAKNFRDDMFEHKHQHITTPSDAAGQLLLSKDSYFHLGVDDMSAVDENASIAFDGKIDSSLYKMSGDTFGLRVVDIAGSAFPGQWRLSRRYPMIIDAPSWQETTTSIQLPPGYDIVPRLPIMIVTPFAEYAAGFVRAERTLRFSRRVILKKHVIQLEEWPTFRDFLQKIEDAERDNVTLWRK